MTREEAKANQDEIAKHFDLSWWYGTGCEKCCGVFPKFQTSLGFDGNCWYECEVCGKRTEPQAMPWLAREEWNAGRFVQNQICLW